MLQQHLDFFDLDKDGVVSVSETFRALRSLDLGWEPFNTLLAAWLALVFHVVLSYWVSERDERGCIMDRQ